MRIAYLDCFSGISGDMFLGALLDAGVAPSILTEAIAALNIGTHLEISRVNRSGISATKVNVIDNGLDKASPSTAQSSDRDDRAHHHSHDDAHDHADGHEHSHGHSHSEGSGDFHTHSHGANRGLKEIREIILKAKIRDEAKQKALKMFETLGAAEAKIHNMPVEKVHFHEVGAVDAMVDIVCAAVGSEALRVDEIICSPLNVGGGTVKCAHGVFPVPAPATLELLRDSPVYSSGIQAELVTPTGAAIVKTLVKRFSQFPAMKIEKAGYGAGSHDFTGHANVLRITIGELQTDSGSSQETITVLEANLDDLNPQVFGYVIDRLFEENALDVFGMPVQMKKNRPGMLLTVLCHPGDAAKMSHLIFSETSTLGIRRRDEQRQALTRKWTNVSTKWGDVRMKVANMNGSVTNYAPEYEDCRRIAREKRVPLKDVMQAALNAYVKGGSSDSENGSQSN